MGSLPLRPPLPSPVRGGAVPGLTPPHLPEGPVPVAAPVGVGGGRSLVAWVRRTLGVGGLRAQRCPATR